LATQKHQKNNYYELSVNLHPNRIRGDDLGRKEGYGPGVMSIGECEHDFRANKNQEHQEVSRHVMSKNNEIKKM
jgi:hypothetical protein